MVIWRNKERKPEAEDIGAGSRSAIIIAFNFAPFYGYGIIV